jgi:transcriptional regulator of PTS gene
MLYFYLIMENTTAEIKVLKAIFFLDVPTRNEIAGITGISTVSVTSILTDLQKKGLVSSAGKTTPGRGRPATIIRIAGGFGCSLGVAIGTDRLLLTAISSAGDLLEETEIPLALSPQSGNHLPDVLGQANAGMRRFLENKSLAGKKFFAACAALPGMVDTARGIWLNGLHLSGIRNIDFGSMLGTALGLPVLVEDPARCAAQLAFRRMGAAQAGDLVLLYLGTGVGAGIILGGELYRGSRGLAGEVGHLIVDPEGTRCSCGSVGCLETVVSAPAILRRFQRRLAEGVFSSLQETSPDALTLEAIRDAALAGDRLALTTLFELGGFLGDACAKIIQLYNPKTLMVGGSAGALGEFFREAVWVKLRHQIMPEMLVDFRLEFLIPEPHDDALGAALIARRWAWQHAERYAQF